MSQSDYLKYKRVSTQLRVDTNNKQPPVFESKNYLDFVEYNLENTITNKKVIYNMLTPSGEQIVFNMEKKVSNCPSFIGCKNTNARTNRMPMSSVYYTPTPQPLNWQQMKNKSDQKNGCKCILNSKYTNNNICSCKLSN
jgi:hypothetical protein